MAAIDVKPTGIGLDFLPFAEVRDVSSYLPLGDLINLARNI